jgi:hypothetical protein
VDELKRTTRRGLRCNYEFLDVLEEDFGISQFALRSAFMGVPAAPKKHAIKLCEWAMSAADGDTEEAGAALRAWAKDHKSGVFNPRLLGAPPLRWDGRTGFEPEGV